MEVRRELSSQIAQTDARLTTAMTGLLNYIVQEEKRSGETLQNFSASSRGELERMNSILAKEFLSLQGMVDARFAKVLETNAGAAEGLGKRLNEELKEMRATLNQALGKVREENAQKRIFRMRFTFKNKKYDKGKQYYLVVYDEESGLEQWRQPVIMDIAFADDFGFGF